MVLNLTITILVIHGACAAFQLLTCILQQKKLLNLKRCSEIFSNTNVSQVEFVKIQRMELAALDRYILFLSCRFLFLCIGLFILVQTDFLMHSGSTLSCFIFLSTIQLFYMIFTIPQLWRKTKHVIQTKNQKKAALICSFISLLLLKLLQKLFLIAIFVPFYRFVMEFLISGTIIFFLFKVICASFAQWTVNDSRYANFDDSLPIFFELKDLCSKSEVSLDKIYYETSKTEHADTDSNTSQDITRSMINAENEQEMDPFSGDIEMVEDSCCSAYVYGFLHTKRLVIEKGIFTLLTQRELIAICAHEIGHWKKEHNLYRFIFYYVQNFIVFCLFKLAYVKREQLGALFELPFDNLLFLMFIILSIVPIYYRLTDLLLNLMTRYQEIIADRYAVKLGYGDDLISALCKIYIHNKLSIDPHLIYSLFNVAQCHPPLILRINNIRSNQEKND